jgi:hypothetical protein
MRILVGATLLLATAAAFAQRVPVGVPVPDGSSRHDRRAARAAAEEAAEDAQAGPQTQAGFLADAARAGDDQLTCDELKDELASIQANPAIQFVANQNAASAEETAKQMQQTIEQMQANRPSMIGGMAKGMAQSFNPLNAIGLGALGAGRRAARQQAQMQEQIAQMQSALPAGFENLADGDGGFDSVMPLMMRSQRVRDLAHTQHCDWVDAAVQPPPQQEHE